MSESVATGLKVAAAVLITVALISIVVIIFNQSAGSATSASEDFSGIEQELSQQQFIAYDDTRVSGSVVSNALRKYKQDGQNGMIGVYVETGKNSGGGTWYYQNASNPDNLTDVADSDQLLKRAKDVKDANYINASGQFNAELVYDESNAVRAVLFVQD